LTGAFVWPSGQAVSIFNNSEEAKRIDVACETLMTGCDCIQTLSKLENGNAVAVIASALGFIREAAPL